MLLILTRNTNQHLQFRSLQLVHKFQAIGKTHFLKILCKLVGLIKLKGSLPKLIYCIALGSSSNVLVNCNKAHSNCPIITYRSLWQWRVILNHIISLVICRNQSCDCTTTSLTILDKFAMALAFISVKVSNVVTTGMLRLYRCH